MKIQNKKILVTGGAGFIGSNLCSRLLLDGHNVICIDDLTTGSKHNLKALETSNNFEFMRHDLANAVPDEHFDQIYNLACPASPLNYQKDPIKTIETCFLGASNVLKLAEKTGATVLQASTSEIYGDPNVHPQNEDYWGNVNPIGTRACYDEGKRIAEALFFEYHRQRGIKIKCARIFNTYGPKMRADDGRVVSNFITQAILGKEITIYGSGNQTRSFCYIDDMLDGLIKLMNSSESVTGPVNLGNPDEFTVAELASKVIEISGSSSQIVHMDLPSDDPKMRKPNITKAKALLDWSPKIKLIDGLKATLEFFAKELNSDKQTYWN